jgi:hypothetical protein
LDSIIKGSAELHLWLVESYSLGFYSILLCDSLEGNPEPAVMYADASLY